MTQAQGREEAEARRKAALREFWNTIHESMVESCDFDDESKEVEVHIKPFSDFTLAAVWEDRIGMTLLCHIQDQEHRDFSLPSYLEPEHIAWIVEVAARHGIRHEPKKKPEA